MRYGRATQRRVKRASTLQNKRRKAFRKAANLRTTLQEQRLIPLWQNYAATHSHRNRKGHMVTLTWWNIFLKINIYRLYNNLEPMMYPPND